MSDETEQVSQVGYACSISRQSWLHPSDARERVDAAGGELRFYGGGDGFRTEECRPARIMACIKHARVVEVRGFR